MFNRTCIEESVTITANTLLILDSVFMGRMFFFVFCFVFCFLFFLEGVVPEEIFNIKLQVCECEMQHCEM